MPREVRDTGLKSTVEIASAIRRGTMSSSEVLERFVRRVDEYNPSLNAVVIMNLELARERARLADEALSRGEVWGAPHGLPMTIKDSFDTVGLISTGGTLGRSKFVPSQDATVVSRLKDAGAILLGAVCHSVLLGLRELARLARLAPAAYWASWADSLQSLARRFGADSPVVRPSLPSASSVIVSFSVVRW